MSSKLVWGSSGEITAWGYKRIELGGEEVRDGTTRLSGEGLMLELLGTGVGGY